MKFKSKKRKPAVGMELSATISMRAGQSADEAAEALLTFMNAITALSNATQAVWIHIYCDGIPAELEAKVQSAIDACARPSHLKLIINNPTA